MKRRNQPSYISTDVYFSSQLILRSYSFRLFRRPGVTQLTKLALKGRCNSQGLKLLEVISVKIPKKKKRSLDYFKFVVVFVFFYVYIFLLHCAAYISLQTPEFLSVPLFCRS